MTSTSTVLILYFSSFSSIVAVLKGKSRKMDTERGNHCHSVNRKVELSPWFPGTKPFLWGHVRAVHATSQPRSQGEKPWERGWQLPSCYLGGRNAVVNLVPHGQSSTSPRRLLMLIPNVIICIHDSSYLGKPGAHSRGFHCNSNSPLSFVFPQKKNR